MTFLRISELKLGHWYAFTDYKGVVSYCRYVGAELHGKTNYLYGGQHIFHFLDGCKYDYSESSIGTCMVSCSKIFSDYLDLFGLWRSI